MNSVKIPPTPFITLRALDVRFCSTTAAAGARMGTNDSEIGAAVTYGINARFEITAEGRAAMNAPAPDMSLRGVQRRLSALFGDQVTHPATNSRIHHPRRQ